MRNLATNITLAFLMIFITVSQLNGASKTTSTIFRNVSMKKIAQMAKAERKPILIYISADYCGQSQKQGEVLSRKEVVTYMNQKFVCKNLNASNIFNQMRASGYGVTQVPSYVFMTPSGKIVSTMAGYKKADQMVAEAEKALSLMKDSNGKQL
jgi:thioredoxin-related protein